MVSYNHKEKKLDQLRQQDKGSDQSDGWLKINVLEAQNVPFENTAIEFQSHEDTFLTTYEPTRFPKYNQSYKFHNLGSNDVVNVSMIGETSDQKLVNVVKVNDLMDQKLHDKWITMVDSMTDRITDVKVRLVLHYVFSPTTLCEEAILGWQNHLSNLKYDTIL